MHELSNSTKLLWYVQARPSQTKPDQARPSKPARCGERPQKSVEQERQAKKAINIRSIQHFQTFKANTTIHLQRFPLCALRNPLDAEYRFTAFATLEVD
jgi:hypothetical protein